MTAASCNNGVRPLCCITDPYHRRVRLEPLYSVAFTYPEGWSVELRGEHGVEWRDLYIAEGTCSGRLEPAGCAAPTTRGGAPTAPYRPDFQGVIETEDGAQVMFDWRGYGRAYPAGRRQIVVTGTHLSEDERYRWLNDSVSVGDGARSARARTTTASTWSSSSPSSCGSRSMDEQPMRRMTAS